MAKYQDIYGNITEVGSPELNPDLIAGKTLVPDTTSLSTSITASSLAPITPIAPTIPPQPGIIDTTGGEAVIDYYNKQLAGAPADTKPESLKSLFDKYLSESGVPQKEEAVTTAQTAEQAAMDELNAINAQLAGFTAEAQAIPIRLQKESEGRGITAGGLAPLQAGQLRENALRAIPFQVQALAAQAKVAAAQGKTALAQGALTAATNKLNTLFQVVSKDVENTYNYWKDLRDKAATLATDAQKTKLASQQKEDDRKFTNWQNAVNEAQTQANALLSTQPELAAKIGARIGQSADYRDTKLVGDVAVLVGQAKVTKEVGAEDLQFVSGTENQPAGTFNKKTGVFTPLPISVEGGISDVLKGEFGDIVSSAANLVGAERGRTSKKSIANSIANKDYISAYAQVANNVEESLTGEVKTKFANARTDYSVMLGLKEAIQDFSDAGGNMGYLKGTADQIARRFGQLKTDPKFAALAVQLEREFQSYRQNMTGAAFSPAESREYAAVNPRTNATLDLNLATIEGALNQLENRVVSTINTRVPNAKKLYNKATENRDGLSDDDAYNEYLNLLGQNFIFSPTGK